MATKLEGDQTLKRLIHVHGVEGDVEVSLSEQGLAFRVPGTRTYLTMSWTKAISESETPTTVKSYHMGKPMEFLTTTAKSVRQRKVERAEKPNDGSGN
jgi:hypothetical protein